MERRDISRLYEMPRLIGNAGDYGKGISGRSPNGCALECPPESVEAD
jgi:hypothetical protein